MVKNVTKFHQAKISLKIAAAKKDKNRLNTMQQSYIPAAQRLFKPDMFDSSKTGLTKITEKTAFPNSIIQAFLPKKK